ncbi:hypothetical protein BH18ACI4_BH18ACI4_28740 [soil metagenome]
MKRVGSKYTAARCAAQISEAKRVLQDLKQGRINSTGVLVVNS